MKKLLLQYIKEHVRKSWTIIVHGYKFLCHSNNPGCFEYMDGYIFPADQKIKDLRTYYCYDIVDDNLYARIMKYRLNAIKSELIPTFTSVFYRKIKAGDLTVFFSEDRMNSLNERKSIVIQSGPHIFTIESSRTKCPERFLLRVIRELLIRSLEGRRASLLHGAAVDIGGRGAAIIGKTGSGKTTLMINILQATQGKFLANDRTMLLPGRDIKILYIPFCIRIGAGTCLENNCLRSGVSKRKQAFSRYRFNSEEWLDYSKVRLSKDWYSSKKLELTPKEFCNLLKINFIEKTSLHYILQPVLVPESKVFEVERIKQEADELIGSQLYTPYDENFINDWLLQRNISERRILLNANNLKKRIVSSARILKIYFGSRLNGQKSFHRQLAGMLDS